VRADNIAFVGAPGSGKSYAARLRCEHHPRVIYFDPLDTAYFGFGMRPGEKWSHLFGPQNIDGAVWLMENGPSSFRATVQAGQLNRAERNEALVKLCEAAEGSAARFGTWTTVIVEELGLVLPRGGAGSSAAVEPVERLLRIGRHPSRRVTVYLVSQRAVDLPPTMRALCERFEIRRQSEQVDLDRMDQIRKGLGEQVRKLQGHEYLVYEGGVVAGPYSKI